MNSRHQSIVAQTLKQNIPTQKSLNANIILRHKKINIFPSKFKEYELEKPFLKWLNKEYDYSLKIYSVIAFGGKKSQNSI